MSTLVVQAYLSGHWHDALRLVFDDPGQGPQQGACTLSYLAAYLSDHLDDFGKPTAAAVSANLPLSWEVERLPHWPAFLQDILPAGAARRFLLPRLGLTAAEAAQTDFQLLSRCTPAPIGHLRIRESLDGLAQTPSVGFTREQVIARDQDFLEYAYEQGAAIGGATGAGGDAPKLLLAEDAQGLLHPDATLTDDLACRHWLVKFPRNKGNATDQDILRSEHGYYRALNTLGLETVAENGLALEEGRRPSLWLPRFDRCTGPQHVERLAVESLYSLTHTLVPGSYLNHLDAIGALIRVWRAAGQEREIPALLDDYLRRDLLNQMLGNSDNHGRNTAILRDEHRVRLAPLYDLAPMVMDEQGITRTSKWPAPVEQAGAVDWYATCRLLAEWDDPERLWEALKQNAEQLRALPDLLQPMLPRATWEHPRIPLRRLDSHLREAGLL